MGRLNSVYVELFDARDSVVCRVKTGLESSMFSGYINIPEDVPEGDYIIRAYTGAMRNLDEDYFFMKNIRIGDPMSRMIKVQPEFDQKPYRKYIKIPFPNDDFDVSFYPEGGSALYGCMGHIAFKAMQRDGTEIDVSGMVYDGQGNEITQFTTDARGIGQFMLMPEKNERYYAVCTNNKGQSKRFELPAAKEDGYALSATWGKDNLMVKVNLTTNEEGKASFRFFTADTPATYTVVIEGVTEDGKIVYKRDKITVNSKIQ